MYIFMCVCMYVYMYVHMCECVYVCMCVFVYIYIYIYIHIYISTTSLHEQDVTQGQFYYVKCNRFEFSFLSLAKARVQSGLHFAHSWRE